MAKRIRFEHPQFGAREAERLTGVSLVTQRDWRRRGLLSNATDNQGRATYEPAEIVELMMINTLVSMGVDVSNAKNVFGVARLPIEVLIAPEFPERVSPFRAHRFIVIAGDEIYRTSDLEEAIRTANSCAL